jgi:hypothetical protein
LETHRDKMHQPLHQEKLSKIHTSKTERGTCTL